MDPHKRLYFSCPVLNPAPITTLQKSFQKYLEPSSADNFHLTIFHYGKPLELYSEIQQVRPQLAFDDFIKNLEQSISTRELLKSSNFLAQGQSLSQEIAVGESLVEFGETTSPILVLKITIPQDILKIRNSIYETSNKFLKSCGISNPELFMSTSQNLKYQIDYHPHISLGLIKNNQPIDLTQDISQISLQLGPIKIN